MKKIAIILFAFMATVTVTSAQVRVYVDMNSKSAYVLTDLEKCEVTFLANNKPVMTMHEQNRLAPYMPIRVFEDLAWSVKNYDAYNKDIYSFQYGEKVRKDNFWEISVNVKWEENGVKKDSVFIPCCPSNITYISHHDIMTANTRDSLEARAYKLRAKLAAWDIDLKWKGYQGDYFVIRKKQNDSITDKFSFYLSNNLNWVTNDSVITITGLPYKNPCKNYVLENQKMNLTINNQWPKGRDYDVTENYFVIKIRKNGKNTLETFLVNKKKEGVYYF